MVVLMVAVVVLGVVVRVVIVAHAKDFTQSLAVCKGRKGRSKVRFALED